MLQVERFHEDRKAGKRRRKSYRYVLDFLRFVSRVLARAATLGQQTSQRPRLGRVHFGAARGSESGAQLGLPVSRWPLF
jgi:hypothetical protein